MEDFETILYQKLSVAESIFKSELLESIDTIHLIRRLNRLKIVLKDFSIIFVQYNPYNEYSYSIIFSPDELDRIRFDNYDDRWDVISRPHHLHIRRSKEVQASSMIGNPEKDIPTLIKLIKESI